MPISVILGIALVTAAFAAMNGFVGSIFLLLIWLWLYGGALPSIWQYLRVQPEYSWAPHLILPLVLFLIIWQWKLRGKIGPQWGVRDLIRRYTARRTRLAV
jgi:hypothetical protein